VNSLALVHVVRVRRYFSRTLLCKGSLASLRESGGEGGAAFSCRASVPTRCAMAVPASLVPTTPGFDASSETIGSLSFRPLTCEHRQGPRRGYPSRPRSLTGDIAHPRCPFDGTITVGPAPDYFFGLLPHAAADEQALHEVARQSYDWAYVSMAGDKSRLG
jgi:hypothetical protein